jgi:hypothetical protein
MKNILRYRIKGKESVTKPENHHQETIKERPHAEPRNSPKEIKKPAHPYRIPPPQTRTLPLHHEHVMVQIKRVSKDQANQTGNEE